jgi:hypothetical protein
MLLTAQQRVKLLEVLPRQESIDTLRIVMNLRESLGLTEQEHKKYLFTDPADGLLKWTPEGLIEEAEIEIGEKAMDICKAALSTANSQHQLTEQHITVYDKFVNPKGE